VGECTYTRSRIHIRRGDALRAFFRFVPVLFTTTAIHLTSELCVESWASSFAPPTPSRSCPHTACSTPAASDRMPASLAPPQSSEAKPVATSGFVGEGKTSATPRRAFRTTMSPASSLVRSPFLVDPPAAAAGPPVEGAASSTKPWEASNESSSRLGT
jgi:hypothetical protein